MYFRLCGAGSLQLIQTTQFICFPLSSSRMDPEGGPHSPEGEPATTDQNPKNQRSLRSLHTLATRFVRLLQKADGGVLDLKEVSELKPVQQTLITGDVSSFIIICQKCVTVDT